MLCGLAAWLSAGAVESSAARPVRNDPPAVATVDPSITADHVREWLQEWSTLEQDEVQAVRRRGEIVRRIRRAGADALAELAVQASQDGAPLEPAAKALVRETFDSIGQRLLTEADLAVGERQARLEDVFAQLVDVYPIEEHHHGGLQKRALAYLRFGRYERGLAAYRQWKPPRSFCGTCDAAIQSEKVAGIIRCLRGLDRTDEAIELCWTQVLGNDLGPVVPFALTLVEMYEEQKQLDELVKELNRRAGAGDHGANVVSEYLAIVEAFEAKQYADLLPHLKSSYNPFRFNAAESGRRNWKPRVVAERFGRLGKDAIVLLSKFLQNAERFEPWAVHALGLTGSPAAVKPVVKAATPPGALHRQVATYLETDVVQEVLVKFPKAATRELIPLLRDDNPDVVRDAIIGLAEFGTEEALEPLIHRMDDPVHAQWCLWALWRRTGETLGTESWSQAELVRRGRNRWLTWWTFQGGTAEVKPPTWWQTPEALLSLQRARASTFAPMSRTAARLLSPPADR